MRTEKVELIAGTEFNGNRITTFRLTIPTHTRTHLLTHRKLSRNSSSTRAMRLEDCDFGYIPAEWPLENNRMCPMEVCDDQDAIQEAEKLWVSQKDSILEAITKRNDIIHREIYSRLLDPWKLHTVLVTATDFLNFFALRRTPHAQESIRYVANEMFYLLEDYYSKYKVKHNIPIHLPFISEKEMDHAIATDTITSLFDISAARCAGVSYSNNFKPVDSCNKLAAKLKRDKHMSPFEHQAIFCDSDIRHNIFDLHGNFCDYVYQYRKIIENGLDLEHVIRGIIVQA